jgi:regulator of cell morphogenesis and NO signaling
MTEKYRATDPMSDLISDDYRMLQVISRFGMSFGFGDAKIDTVCKECGVDASTFLAVVNFIRNGEYVKISELIDDVDVRALMDYLKRSHAYYINFRLPAIKRKLLEAMSVSSNQIAVLILKFYDEYAAEVSRHMEYENEYVHPYVEQLLEGRIPSSEHGFHALCHRHQDNHGSIERSSSELKNIIIKYYPSESNIQLLNDVLMDIYMMEEDMLSHCRLEDQLFAESVHRLEDEIRLKRPQEEYTPTHSQHESNDTLSDREKEVIIEVVKGLSNKEIAENMFISVNTVMTHRRNISKKLNIHSPAGLTIYAIVNGLVNLDEIKI